MAGPYRIQLNGKDYYFSRPEEVVILVGQRDSDRVEVYYLDVAKISLNFEEGKVNVDSVQVTPHVSNSYGSLNQPEMLAPFLMLTELCAKLFLLEKLQQLNDKGISTLIDHHNVNFRNIPENLSLYNMLIKTNHVLEKIKSRKFQDHNSIASIFYSNPATEMQKNVSTMLDRCGIENLKSLQAVKEAMDVLQQSILLTHQQQVIK